ncbi:hypothetical protein [Spirosoma pulveris]
MLSSGLSGAWKKISRETTFAAKTALTAGRFWLTLKNEYVC